MLNRGALRSQRRIIKSGVKIVIDVGECRNAEAGDWYEDKEGTVHIRTVEMPLYSQIAVAIHELIEYLTCKQAGITDDQVTRFDAQFLKERMAGKHPIEAEAGNDNRAPYHHQHKDATFVERCVCAILGLPWKQHERNVFKAAE